MAKIKMLQSHGIRPFLGGQFQEYVLHLSGIDAMNKHLAEARAIGLILLRFLTTWCR